LTPKASLTKMGEAAIFRGEGRQREPLARAGGLRANETTAMKRSSSTSSFPSFSSESVSHSDVSHSDSFVAVSPRSQTVSQFRRGPPSAHHTLHIDIHVSKRQ
jgi:hypothetical protein